MSWGIGIITMVGGKKFLDRINKINRIMRRVAAFLIM